MIFIRLLLHYLVVKFESQVTTFSRGSVGEHRSNSIEVQGHVLKFFKF